MSDRTATRTRQSLRQRDRPVGAGPRSRGARRAAGSRGQRRPTARGGSRRRPVARVRRGRSRRASSATTSAMLVEAGRVDRRDRPVGPPPRPRPPAGRPRARVVARTSRRRATRRRASSGNASSTSSASGATARATTAGQRSRWRGSAASVLGPDRARPRRVGASPVAATTVARNVAFLPTDSTSSARAAGSAAASGMPGKPPPLPRSTNASDAPRRRSTRTRGQAVDDVRRIAIATGSRIAVRLIAAFQARRSRTWPSIAAGRRRSQREPERREARRRGRRSYSGGRSGRPSTRVGSGSRGRSRHPSCRSCLCGPSGLRSRRRRSSHRGRTLGLPRPVRFAAGSPRAPREPRYPRRFGADAGR